MIRLDIGLLIITFVVFVGIKLYLMTLDPIEQLRVSMNRLTKFQKFLALLLTILLLLDAIALIATAVMLMIGGL